jgi:hypothetical protein
MATSSAHINTVQQPGQFATPIQLPAMPTRPPDKLPNHLDITKHIQDVDGITNVHVHTIGHNNDAIEFIGKKDHISTTQWPITSDMSNIISNNNNLNRKYQPLVIPYSAACYVCNENKNKMAKKISIYVLVAIVIIIIIFIIIIIVNRNAKTIDDEDDEDDNAEGENRDDRGENRDDRGENRDDRGENSDENR